MLFWFEELNKLIDKVDCIKRYFYEISDRYADTGDAAARHPSYAGQRLVTVLLRLLHIRYRRCAAVGGHTAPALLPQGSAQRQVSRVSRREPWSRPTR